MAVILAGAVPLVAMLAVMWTQYRVRNIFARHADIVSDFGQPAHQAARYLLASVGLRDVRVTAVPGTLTDHYDAARRELRLSEGVYADDSIAAVAIAAHEVGHAMQDALGHPLLRLRVLVARVASGFAAIAPLIMVAGLVGGIATRHPTAFAIAASGVVGLLLALLLAAVALPVELDASRRAQRSLEAAGITTAAEGPRVRELLHAAALTYLASLVGTFARILMGGLRGFGRIR